MMPGMAPDPHPDEVPSPLDYPGRRLRRSALLQHGRLVDWAVGDTPMDGVLADLGAAPLDARALVLGVGSNADPRRVLRKLRSAGTGTVVPFVTCTVAGLAVTHSAHVSAGGYVPMTPAERPGGEVALVAAYVDPGQLAALDATEPNYQRLLLDGARSRAAAGRRRAAGVRLRLPVPARRAPAGRGAAAAAGTAGAARAAVPWPRPRGGGRWVDGRGAAAALCLPDVQQRVQECFRALGWVADSGLRGELSGA